MIECNGNLSLKDIQDLLKENIDLMQKDVVDIFERYEVDVSDWPDNLKPTINVYRNPNNLEEFTYFYSHQAYPPDDHLLKRFYIPFNEGLYRAIVLSFDECQKDEDGGYGPGTIGFSINNLIPRIIHTNEIGIARPHRDILTYLLHLSLPALKRVVSDITVWHQEGGHKFR